MNIIVVDRVLLAVSRMPPGQLLLTEDVEMSHHYSQYITDPYCATNSWFSERHQVHCILFQLLFWQVHPACSLDPLSPQHGALSGCRWRVVLNILNK
jgi:hypothetical protein